MTDQDKVKKTIYLDWNVFQDIFQSRRGDRLLENINAAKLKGFVVPFSHAHMSDLSRCSSETYIDSDLDKIDLLTDSTLITRVESSTKFVTGKASARDVYKVNHKDVSTGPDLPSIIIGFESYEVDRGLVSENNMMLPYLDKFGNRMCPELLILLIEDLVLNVFTDYKVQRDFRGSFAEIVKIGNPANQRLLDMPLYKSIFSSKEEIEGNFLELVESLLSITGKNTKSIGKEELYTTAYGLLDFFPVFKEKIEKRNNINNMLTDGLHVYIASRCSYFVGGDEKMLEKAKLIYKAFGEKTKILDVDKFSNNVEF